MMTTTQEWIAGSRPRTWANALSSGLAGIAVALKSTAHIDIVNALIILLLSFSLIIGVNYANDYSDGIKGTDDEQRRGPLRLVGSGTASPQSVKRAAITTLIIATILGIILCWRVQSWGLLIAGALCIIAAWAYTGGPLPFGYHGYGEIAVFVFFGLIGVLGSQYALSGIIDIEGFTVAISIGAFSSAILASNNLRDIDNDATHGKITVAVRCGSNFTRNLILSLIGIPFIISAYLCVSNTWMILTFLALFPAYTIVKMLQKEYTTEDLITVLALTTTTMLLWSVLVFIAHWEYHYTLFS